VQGNEAYAKVSEGPRPACEREPHRGMSDYGARLSILIALGVTGSAKADTWFGGVGAQLSEPSLIVKVHKHCTKVFVCDYFAPATSCSVPPCCKKGHWEKSCVKT
jgi:hypothetical protein